MFWSNKGNAFYHLGNNTEAIKSLDRAIELDPKLAFAWDNKGNVLDDLGNQEDAIKYYDTAIELDSNLSLWHGSIKVLHSIDFASLTSPSNATIRL